MDLLHGKVGTIYKKYLTAAFGSAFMSSIYGLADMAMVGQYQGPSGTAALAVVAPVWNIIYSLGLLTGIGGSVLYGNTKGQQKKGRLHENEYFTAAVIGTILFAALSWVALIFFEQELLYFFGAEATLLPLARQYLLPVKFTVPVFVFNQMLAAFLRNDGNPRLATSAVLAGGIFNIGGDYFFVFVLDMGILGAGIATAAGALITFSVMLTHFFSKRNTLRIVKINGLFVKLKVIIVTGFATFFIDIAMGILTVMFNRQIMKYSGTDALAVYGVVVNISTMVQCCAYSAGQASQPIISINFGAKQWGRIREVLVYALATVGFFGIVWTAVALAFPNGFICLFMSPTEKVLEIAPFIIRCYGISFLLLPLNIFSTYYFQSLMKPGISFFISVARGVGISGLFIYLLPEVFGEAALWLSMPLTEVLIAAVTVLLIKKYTETGR